MHPYILQYPTILLVDREGPDQTVQIHRLIRTFTFSYNAAHIIKLQSGISVKWLLQGGNFCKEVTISLGFTVISICPRCIVMIKLF